MSQARIFLISEDETSLTPMTETAYETEEVLQLLLARHVDLLPGDQITPEHPRRWLLVSRELGIPDREEGNDRWSLDHLFLDQDGIPAFVECKRSSDTRNRREVVAQMLDYAANGLAYWSIDRLRQKAAETLDAAGQSLDDKITELLGAESETDVEGYWTTVEENLRNGRVRLIFVADYIPRELRRLIEFMNDKMEDIEVFAVEIKQFLGEGRKALVPRVIGITEKARERKEAGSQKRQPITREKFLAQCSPVAARFFTKAFNLAEEKGYVLSPGGQSIVIRTPTEGGRYASFAYCWPPDLFEFYFRDLPFSAEQASALRQELLASGIFQESGKLTLSAKLNEDVLGRMSEIYQDILERVSEENILK